MKKDDKALKPLSRTSGGADPDDRAPGAPASPHGELNGRAFGDPDAAALDRANARPIRNVNFFLSVADHRNLRLHAIAEGRSLQSIMAEALNLYLQQRGLPPIELVKAYRR